MNVLQDEKFDLKPFETSWNPCTGCTPVSDGCDNCSAEIVSRRVKARNVKEYANDFKPTMHMHRLLQPYMHAAPIRVEVASMSDLFHEEFTEEFLVEVFSVMRHIRHVQFFICTKRISRVLKLLDILFWPENIWLGVSVENQESMHRVRDLHQVPAYGKFIVFEPLLGHVYNYDLHEIDWVIAGGEQYKGARPMDVEWIRSIRDKCVAANVPFFFKGWDNGQKKVYGKMLDGVIWQQLPKIEVREDDY